jgi:hypothetical protein
MGALGVSENFPIQREDVARLSPFVF